MLDFVRIKTCRDCGEVKSVHDFPQQREGEKIYFKPDCRECSKKYNKKWNTSQGFECALLCGTKVTNPTYFCSDCNGRYWRSYGGEFPTSHGYTMLSGKWGHPNANSKGRVLEHIMVYADHHNRRVETENGENIHHKNGDKQDNRIENLEMWVTKQPKGQRPEDLVEWAVEIMNKYATEGDRKQVR